MLSVLQLQEIMYSNTFKKQVVAEKLIQAITDWSNPVESVEAYIIQVKEMFGLKEVTKEALEIKLGKLSPHNRAWEIESITSFIDAFSLSKTKESKSLIKFLSETTEI